MSRFVLAQEGIHELALAELQNGHKRTHWMWFIFPQISGLGKSPTAITYGIRNRAEAAAFLAHPLLGERLLACTRTVLELNGPAIPEIFTFPDNLKFHSSMTLFAEVSEPGSVFHRVLDKYFHGSLDLETMKRLG